LISHGYDVQIAATGEEALDLAASAPPDVIILDLMMPSMSGLAVCKELRQ